MKKNPVIIVNSETVTNVSIDHADFIGDGVVLEIDFLLYGKLVGNIELEHPNIDAIRELASMINQVADKWEKTHSPF
tara:strand:- start:7335 stop:7565 length:231 start_codon:yes stop_codon:yes gene_type:complete